LNRAETKKLVEANGVVVLKADKTTESPEADALLRRLGNEAKAIPFYAVFPAGEPNRPITLDGVFVSPAPILEALEEAGPSRGVGRRDSDQPVDTATAR
jgi:thiol:disulfide interchange protein